MFFNLNKLQKFIVRIVLFTFIVQILSYALFALEPVSKKSTVRAAGIDGFGVNAHIKQRYYNEKATAFSKMTTAGVQTAREQFIWGDIEISNNNWVYTQYDQLAQDYDTNSISPLGLLAYGTDWASTYPGQSDSDMYLPNLDAWADFVQHTVERYDGDGNSDVPGGYVISDWEMWNEPNHSGYFKLAPGTNPNNTYYWYGQLLKRGYQAAKAANPNANVVFGGTSGSDVSFIKNVVDQSGGVYFDTMAIHPYRDFGKPEEFKTGQDTLQYQLGQVISLAKNYGNKPIWLTEIGWSTDVPGLTETIKANYLARTFQIALSMPLVQKIFIYDLKDAGDGFGLINSSWSNKTSYSTYQTLISKLSGGSFSGREDVVSQTTIDDVESGGINWNVLRFNSATGNVSRVSDHYSGSAGLKIEYNHDNSSNAYTYLYKPVSIGSGNPIISMALKGTNDFNMVIRVRLRDATGEVFQGIASRSPYNEWQYVTANFNDADQRAVHWDGNNDGVLDGNITFEGIILDKNESIGSNGLIYLDDVKYFHDSNYLQKYIFTNNNHNITCLWAASGNVTQSVNVGSSQIALTSRDGSISYPSAPGGVLSHNFSESIAYVEPTYSSSFQSKSNASTIVMNEGDSPSDVWLKFTNTGLANWYGTGSGSNPKVILKTDNSLGRSSAFSHSSWYHESDQPAMLDESTVAPGAVGTFSFTLGVPSGATAGVYRERFRPIADGTSDMNSVSDAYLDVAYIPTVSSASELNNLVDPRTNPSGYGFWWDYGIPNNTIYRDWFFTQVVPNNSYLYSMLWDKAVPELWASQYYYTYLFDHAIPDKIASSFYYDRFWNKAVPNYWTNGFYYKRLWDKAVPENWVPASPNSYRTIFWTKAIPELWSSNYYYTRLWNKAIPELWSSQHYYTYFWNTAVPDKISSSFYYTRLWNQAVPQLWINGFYYARVWDKAIPENWVSSSPDSYRTTFYIKAVPENWISSYYSSRFWNKAIPELWSGQHYYTYAFNTAILSNLASEYYYNYFWNTAVPTLQSNSFYYARLWDKAVPENWVSESGPPGIYSYKWTFWVKAVPESWSSSFYERRLWDRAIPQNWVSGYYSTTKNQAATEDWASGYYDTSH